MRQGLLREKLPWRIARVASYLKRIESEIRKEKLHVKTGHSNINDAAVIQICQNGKRLRAYFSNFLKFQVFANESERRSH